MDRILDGSPASDSKRAERLRRAARAAEAFGDRRVADACKSIADAMERSAQRKEAEQREKGEPR